MTDWLESFARGILWRLDWIRARNDKRPAGLRTHTLIWVVAATGLALAAQLYFPATVAEIIVFLTLYVLGRVERRVSPILPNPGSSG